MKKVILVVENDAALRQLLLDYIEFDQVYSVVAVENGFEAFKWLSANEAPDLVLTDFNMPGRGDLVARSVVRLNIPVMILTGWPLKAIQALNDMDIIIPVVSKGQCLNTIMRLIDKMTGTKLTDQKAA